MMSAKQNLGGRHVAENSYSDDRGCICSPEKNQGGVEIFGKSDPVHSPNPHCPVHGLAVIAEQWWRRSNFVAGQ